MTTDPGDFVLDPTCGSGTTAVVAEQWGRRWITCDTSRVATTLAKQRLMSATFDYYKLAHPNEGVGSGFEYKKVPHVTLKSIANNEPPGEETLYDQPLIDNSRARISGPFTVEAVPRPTSNPSTSSPLVAPASSGSVSDKSRQDAGATCRRLHRPLRAHAPPIRLARRTPENRHPRQVRPDDQFLPRRTSRRHPLAARRRRNQRHKTRTRRHLLRPDHAPLETRQVEMAWEEARTLNPKPDMLVFAAFQFDPEAAKDIDELTKEKTGMTFLTAQMNADLLTDDLKKKRTSNQSFWLVGRPDVDVARS